MSTRIIIVLCLLLGSLPGLQAAQVYLRARVIEPAGAKFTITTGGFIHNPNWYLPQERAEVQGSGWSTWFDLTDEKKWPLHGRHNREGGLAEWPSLRLTVTRADSKDPINGCALQVQLADKPGDDGVVIDFTEKSGANFIGFLCPTPLREKKGEFETGVQMTQRHLQWAKEASGGKAPELKRFEVATFVWGQQDPMLADMDLQALKLLGFNVTAGVPNAFMDKYGMRTYGTTTTLLADPDANAKEWEKSDAAYIRNHMKTDEGKWTYAHTSYYTIWDEIQTLRFDGIPAERLNGWFHEYLRSKGETDASMGTPIDAIVYPLEEVRKPTLPRDADLTTRKIMYYAAKFGQSWSVKQVRQTTDLIKATLKPYPVRTDTMPSDHHFFNAWGAPYCGMDALGLDFFDFGKYQAVDMLTAEDWLGLNHMFNPFSTWTGGWAFGYLCAIMRCSIGDKPMTLRALLTPSDDGFLRIKTYSGLGQGAKALYFWTYGPTYIGTENYWSDLRSMYDGIAKTTRALAKSEDLLLQTTPARDPVALLYSVSHDYWYTDDPASFVENRLTWTALRQLGIQPDILREEDIEEGRLQDYKVLYLTGQCLTRSASAAIDAWVKNGGVVYLSAGAATRDEYYTPYTPGFASAVWPDNAAGVFTREQGHTYNERTELPTIRPLTIAKVTVAGKTFPMEVIGDRMNLKDGLPADALIARYKDGKPAGACVKYGKGTVVAVGFLPGLAYSPFRQNQNTLDEVWQPEPRLLFGLPLQLGLQGAQTVKLSVPVVEGSLLAGKNGSALVLVNYTYQPINTLKVTLAPSYKFTKAMSTEGVPVKLTRTKAGTSLILPLAWTDIVVLK